MGKADLIARIIARFDRLAATHTPAQQRPSQIKRGDVGLAQLLALIKNERALEMLDTSFETDLQFMLAVDVVLTKAEDILRAELQRRGAECPS